MSGNLSEIFNRSLNLNKDSAEPQLDLTQRNEVEQAQILQWQTLSQRFPSAFAELNDVLRDQTYLLGGTEASDLDAFVFARASKYLPEFKQDEVVANRHVVRWALLVQKLVGQDVVKVDLDTPAPKEVLKKEKKKDAGAGEAKKDKKEAKKQGGAADKSDAAAGASAGAAGEAAGKKKEKKEKKEPKAKPAAAPARAVTPGLINLRVGFIEKAVKHPDADSLYVSTINVGEDEPRTICSGLVKYVPIEDMQKRFVVVVANLKPVKMRGIVSNGMVLCASNKADDKVEFVKVPEGAQPGDKIFFEGFDEEPEPVLNPKKKVWEQIQPDFTTNDSLNVVYKKDGKEHKLINQKGQEFVSSTLKNAAVS